MTCTHHRQSGLRYQAALLLVAALAVLSAGLSAQQRRGVVISGKVTDAETGSPLENVIVFLANTPIGTSSGSNGSFILYYAPTGTDTLTISIVGYERRTIPLVAGRPDSVYYAIRLKPKPVQTREIEILGERPSGGLQQGGLIYPKEGADRYCLFSGAVSRPIGILFTEGALYLYGLEPAVLDSEKYIRVWLLYRNRSQKRYELNPEKCLLLNMRGRKTAYSNITPIPPGTFDSMHVAADKHSIETKYGKTLELAASLHRQYRSERSHFGGLIWTAESDGIFDPRAGGIPQMPEMLSPIALQAIYGQSTNDGVLKRHIVGPGMSFHGYVYFPFPGLNWKSNGDFFPEAYEYTYTVEIRTPEGVRKIEFTPGGLL
jgi:hypothetical protein